LGKAANGGSGNGPPFLFWRGTETRQACPIRRMISAARVLCLITLLGVFSFQASAEELTNALQAFLRERIEMEKKGAMVIGVVDEQGSGVVGCGKLDNGTDQEVDGDTLFEIGSITKTFTALLLQEMVSRGEVKLDDPVAKHLPATFKVPSRNGREITLLHLATHTSGLPLVPENLDPVRSDNPYADYTVEKLKAFLAGYKLPRNPGARYEYSELGMELLGEAIALKAGTNYESLVLDRICRPLKMDSTRVSLTPELHARLATGHDQLGQPLPGMAFQTLVGGSGLHSTANDLLKYLSANLGLTASSLTSDMEKAHMIRFRSALPFRTTGLAWARAYYPQGMEFITHGGATPGYTTFIAFDKTRRRGVVVLSSSGDNMDPVYVGLLLLISEWHGDQRPHETKVSALNYDSYVGEYELSPNISLGTLVLRLGFLYAPKTIICLATGAGLAVVVVLCRYVPFLRKRSIRLATRWRTASRRKRRIIVGGGLALAGLGLLIGTLVAARLACWFLHPVTNIWREGNRLMIQTTSSTHVPSKGRLPHITGELLPQSETQFFERLSGTVLTFSRDAGGTARRLTAPLFGNALSFAKVSDQPPERPKLRTVVKLNPKFYDACVGQYEFPADDLFPHGVKLTLQRRGDGLIGEASSTNGNWGAFDLYPESETNFFFTLTVVGVDLTFVKNAKGEVTSVIRHVGWLSDKVGRKLKAN
jgi:D-alanyl-D-alanine-carboxypeptidase/D-alanyl-D-alanine-endopeptidase